MRMLWKLVGAFFFLRAARRGPRGIAGYMARRSGRRAISRLFRW